MRTTSDVLKRWSKLGSARENLNDHGRGHGDDASLSCSPRTDQQEFNRFQLLMIYLSTGLRLGLANVARALMHRACKGTGIYQWLLPQPKAARLEIRFDLLPKVAEPSATWADPAVLGEAGELLRGKAKYFSVHTHDVGNPPDWFLNPFNKARHPQLYIHWSKIPDFSAGVGDIKIIWELSRFTWALVFARAWRVSGDTRYLSAMQLWIQDWWRRNPPNTGPNWMCGQETAIRLINTLLAFKIAGPETDAGLGDFVELHCRRIDLTKFYAVAQENNHGTSEATGLFVGGSWLARNGDTEAKARGQRWAEKGRRLLENRVSRLILPDGSFSQHSLTYHRMMLATLSVAEAWRRHVGAPSFSEVLYTRAAAATRWLGAMIDSQSGDGPNLGPNDGSHPYHLDTSAYRDFRSCLQLASLLFLSKPALEPGPWDESAAWLGISAEGPGKLWLRDVATTIFPDGGYVVMRNSAGACGLLRAPTARFRPAHADALHLDLWCKGKNLLRDGGTYSYANGAVADGLASVAGHNLCQFDDHDQMPRLGRFLYGSWVRANGQEAITTTTEGQSWAGNYTDPWGAHHKRTVTIKNEEVSVRDEMHGFKRKAVLRWRLAPGNWTRNEGGYASSMGRIHVASSTPICRMSLESRWESWHYLEKSEVPVLEVEVDHSPAVVTTTVSLL